MAADKPKPNLKLLPGGKGATPEQIRLLQLAWKAQTLGLTPTERVELNRLMISAAPTPKDPGPDGAA